MFASYVRGVKIYSFLFGEVLVFNVGIFRECKEIYESSKPNPKKHEHVRRNIFVAHL